MTSSALAFVVTCVFASFMYLHIDTYLSFLSPQVMSCYLGCYFSHANQRPLTLAFLFFPHRSWVVTSVVTSVMRTSGLLHRCPAYYQLWLEIFSFIVLPWSVLSLSWTSGLLHRCPAYYHLWLEIFSFIVLPWSVLSLSWTSGLLHRCPAYYHLWLEIFSFIVLPWSVLCLSWASGLSLCSPAHYQL